MHSWFFLGQRLQLLACVCLCLCLCVCVCVEVAWAMSAPAWACHDLFALGLMLQAALQGLKCMWRSLQGVSGWLSQGWFAIGATHRACIHVAVSQPEGVVIGRLCCFPAHGSRW